MNKAFELVGSSVNTLENVSQFEYSELLKDAVLCGTGSFGSVFRVLWSNRTVALKTFNVGQTDKGICYELSLLAKCDHPNIVRLFAAGPNFPGSVSFLIMEFADCFSVNDVLHKFPDVQYNLYHCLSWTVQVARGADYLHRQCQPPIVHGDLKPANILLFNAGLVAKLTDFSAAGFLGACDHRRPGTLIYTAPEISCVQSDGHLDYTEKCDVYALAITFWEILARQRPYAKSTRDCKQTVFWNVYRRRPDPLRDCPPLLTRLMERGWAEDPKERPTMQLFVALLSQLLDIIFGSTYVPQPLQVPSDPPTETPGIEEQWDAESEEDEHDGSLFLKPRSPDSNQRVIVPEAHGALSRADQSWMTGIQAYEPLSLEIIDDMSVTDASVGHSVGQSLNILTSPGSD